jgi:hypothetical protein
MGFLAPAAPFVPMLIGAGVGALADKNNPLQGALLGAVGGSILGPSMAGLTAGGAAASEAALAAGMAPEAATAAAQYGAAGGAAGAGFSPMQAAMLAEQTAPFGATGIAHTLGSAGVSTPMAKLAALGVSGPQGIFSQMSPKDMMLKSGRMIMGMNQPQPVPQQAPPASAGVSAPRPAPAYQPVRPFVTGMPNMRKREDPWNIWGGGGY